MKNRVALRFREAEKFLAAFRKNENNLNDCLTFINMLESSLRNSGNLFICGNGGSHADALHFAEEMTGRNRINGREPIGVLALGEATHLTCTSNDYGFHMVFSRQLKALGRKGDALILLTTSGNSQNLIEAAMQAKEIGITSLALVGKDGGKLISYVDKFIIFPGNKSDRIQELQMTFLHIVAEMIEEKFHQG